MGRKHGLTKRFTTGVDHATKQLGASEGGKLCVVPDRTAWSSFVADVARGWDGKGLARRGWGRGRTSFMSLFSRRSFSFSSVTRGGRGQQGQGGTPLCDYALASCMRAPVLFVHRCEMGNITVPTVIAGQVKPIRTTVEQPWAE